MNGPVPKGWLLRYYLYRHGPRIAYFMLGLGLMLALLAFRGLYAEQDRQSSDLSTLVDSIQAQRRAQTQAFCDAQNRTTLKLRALIVGGAKQSKAFDRVYRQFGFPPYRERLRQAERQAQGLPLVPCAKFIEQIESSTPPPPGAR